MRPTRAFYVAPEAILGNNFSLDKNESEHAIRVLRMNKDDKIVLLNGQGIGYHGIIKSIKNNIIGEIIETIPNLGENNYMITLAPALIKKNRFEIILEKATELGVRDIQPLIMERSVKRNLNIDRSISLIQTAAKQAKRSRFPDIKVPIKLDNLLLQDGQVICAKINEAQSLSDINFINNEKIIVIIGPEGDFSIKEMKLMKNKSVQFYNLGKRRLRSETAALNSLSILNELLS